MELFSLSERTKATSAMPRTVARLITTVVFASNFFLSRVWQKSSVKALAATSSCESAVDIAAARMAQRKMPPMKAG